MYQVGFLKVKRNGSRSKFATFYSRKRDVSQKFTEYSRRKLCKFKWNSILFSLSSRSTLGYDNFDRKFDFWLIKKNVVS